MKKLVKRVLFIVACMVALPSVVQAQITLSVKDQTIQSVIKQIERGSDYVFFYSNSLPGLDKKRSLTVKDEAIETVLAKLFEGTRISFTIKDDKQVSLMAKNDAKAPSSAPKTSGPQKSQLVAKGVVMDEKGEPVIGATVTQVGTTNGTSTDAFGQWTLALSPVGEQIVEFEYLGYASQRRAVDASNPSMVVAMKMDATQLEDVVVVGYGVQKKVNLTGSIATVRVDEGFADRPVTNISSGLAGLVPGLAVAQASGEAGNNSAELLIRGMGTVNDASPLIVIDGLPGLSLDRVNMEDVESISVLKDAAASAVYGARGANGVILITTKTGKSAQKTQVKFSSSYAISEPTNTFHFLTDYARVMHLQQRRHGVSVLLKDLYFKDATVDEWLAMQMIDPVNYPNTDWWDQITRTGIMQRYNISATGSTDVSNFYASGGYQNEVGQFLNNDHQRYNARFNYDYKVKNNINIGVRFDGSWTNTQSASTGNLWNSIPGIYPYDPETGHYGGTMAYGESISGVNNPLAMLNSTISKRSRQEANASAYLDWSPLKGLKMTVDYIIHFQNTFSASAPMPTGPAWNFQTDSPTELIYVPNNAGIENNISTGWKSQFSTRIDYNTTIARNHDIAILVLYNEESNFSRSLGASREERIDPSLSEINAALTNVQTTSGTSAASGLRSFVGRVNYSAYDRYLLEVNARYDGYSRFTRGHQWGLFPSVSAGWRFSEEDFFQTYMPEAWSNGKFRVSYGSLGNNTGVSNYQQLNTLTSTKYYINDQVVSGLTSTKIINESLTWETTTVLNVGIDLGFFKNRLSIEADYYNRLTEGMIQSTNASMMIGGLSTPKKNMGSLLNRGAELNITWADKVKDLRYLINFNISHNQSLLLSWNEYLDTGTIWIGMPYNFAYMYHDSGFINQTWMDTYRGVPQSKFPGDLLLTDVNGDGQVNRYDMVAYPQYNQDRPTTNYGFNTQLHWKGLSLSMLWQGTYGRMANWRTSYNNFNFDTTGYAPTWDHWNKQWTYDNRYGEWPRAGGGQATANMETTNYWFDDLSYLRLKNLEVAYNLPKKMLKNIGISNVKVYLSGTNLLTFTKFRGLDPEKSNLNDLYPLNKTYSFGINITL